MAGKRATATDAAVGQRIRAFRKAIGISQTALADQVGVTFQQVQKYETGKNRVGAGRLTQIAKALEVPINAFFDGIAKSPKRRAENSSLAELMAQPRADKLLEAFLRIPDPLQVAVLQFVRSVHATERRPRKAIRRPRQAIPA